MGAWTLQAVFSQPLLSDFELGNETGGPAGKQRFPGWGQLEIGRLLQVCECFLYWWQFCVEQGAGGPGHPWKLSWSPTPARVRPCFPPLPLLPSCTGRAEDLWALCFSSLLGSILMGMLLAFHSGNSHLLPVCEHMSPLPTLPPKGEPQQRVPRAPSLSFHSSQGLLAWCWEGPFTHC